MPLDMLAFLEILEGVPKLMRLPDLLKRYLCVKDQKILGLYNNGMCFLA